MLIRDLAKKARRILGDVEEQRWTNERIVDIVNAGIRDINKFAGVYRNEQFIPLQNYRKRYPLPLDMLVITSLKYEDKDVPLLNQSDTHKGVYAVKDQLNVGVLELLNFPLLDKVEPKFLSADVTSVFPAFIGIDLWADGVWNNEGLWYFEQAWNLPITTAELLNAFGVVADPVTTEFGVTSGLQIPSDLLATLKPTKLGLLSNVLNKTTGIVLTNINTNLGGSSAFGVFTNFTLSKAGVVLTPQGTIGTAEDIPIRIAGKYGTVVAALRRAEYVQVRYKALPKVYNTLDEAFPLSASWEEPLINWIVGTALQDDNDAANNTRAAGFISKYARELEEGRFRSSTDYSAPSKKYEVKYAGGIR